MANLLNVPNSGGAAGTLNTGFPLADIIRDIPYGIILMDSGVEFNNSDMQSATTFVAAVKTKSRAARGSRVYPMFALVDFTDNSKAPTKGALGNLTNSEIQLVDGVPAFSFGHRKGDLFHKQLVAAESQSLKIMIVDKKYAVYGTVTTAGNLTGYTLAEFKTNLPQFQTPAAPSKYPFEVTLDSITECKENLGIFQANSTIVNASGINNVVLSVVQVTNVAKITPLATGGKNLGLIYPVELASPSAWVATNEQTGASFTITSVAWDAANLRFNVTLDSTAYTALTALDKVTVDLAATAPLSTLGVDGFESTGPVTITK